MYSLFFQIIGVDEETDEVEISYMSKKIWKYLHVAWKSRHFMGIDWFHFKTFDNSNSFEYEY